MNKLHFNKLVLILAALPIASTIAGTDKQPSPSEPRKVAFVQPKKEKLENGLSVIVVERPGLPLVSAKLLVKSGAEADGQKLAGLADMTASLLSKGTETRTAPEIARELETLGASIETGAKWDNSFVKMTVMSTQLSKALEIVADLVRHPTFKEEEIQRLRSQTLDDLRVSLEEPGTVARYAAAKVIFGDQPYGHSASGTPESIERISRDAIIQLHRTYYRPSNAILVLSGNITLEKGVELARKSFGDWSDPAEPLPELNRNADAAQDRRVVAIDMSGSGQAAVMMGKIGINHTSKDYFSGEVANGVLGGGYSSRLNEEIRVKRGLTYGAGSMLDARRFTGQIIASAQTKNQSAAEVASLMVSELAKLADSPVEKNELTTRKAALVGEFARHFETNEGVASKVGEYELYGLPVDSANSFIDSVEAVTSGEVQSFAGKYMRPNQSSIIIAGEVRAFREPLLKTFKKVEFINKDELDLNETSLKRKPETK